MKNSTAKAGNMLHSHPRMGHQAQPSGDTVSRWKPSRRKFIATCSALAVGASVAPFAFGRTAREVSLEQISGEDFARQLNSTFVVRTERGTAKLVLVDIEPHQNPESIPLASEDASNEKFSLRFRGASVASLSQDTYRFEHQRLGTFVMFIVLVGCEDEPYCYYEAIFNRPPQPTGKRTLKSQSR